MEPEIRTCMLTQNSCYQKNRRITPRGIMIHSTGANNPTLKRYLAPDDGLIGQNRYNNHWNTPGLSVCVHGFIGQDQNGDVRIYQTLPWDMRGWHCGGTGNDTHISFEICEDDLTDRAYFEKTRDAALELCVYLCRTFGLDPQEPGVLVDHREGHEQGIASGHGDVNHWWSRFGYSMNDFRREAALRLQEETTLTREAVQRMIDESMERAKPKVYKTTEAVPAWARETVQGIMERGVLLGRETGDLDLTEDMLRLLVLWDRQEKISKAV